MRLLELVLMLLTGSGVHAQCGDLETLVSLEVTCLRNNPSLGTRCIPPVPGRIIFVGQEEAVPATASCEISDNLIPSFDGTNLCKARVNACAPLEFNSGNSLCEAGEAVLRVTVVCTQLFLDPCRPTVPGRIVFVGASSVFPPSTGRSCALSFALERSFTGGGSFCFTPVTSCVNVCDMPTPAPVIMPGPQIGSDESK